MKSVPTIGAIALLVFLCLSPPAGAGSPLAISNGHPLFLSVGAPPFLSARAEDALLANLSYSSTYLVKASAEWDVGADLETLRLDLRFSRVIAGTTELSLNLPILSYNSGFLDGFVDAYHDAFGFADYGRDSRPSNAFLLRVNRRDDLFLAGESGGFGLGDLQVGIKQPLLTDDPSVSLYAYAELPTGDAGRGYGSGSLDWGVLLLVDRNLTPRFNLYMNAGMVFVDAFRARQKVDLDDYLCGAAGLEWLVSGPLSVHAQVSFQESPYRTGIGAVDRVASILSFGGRYAFGDGSALEMAFSEDTNTAGAPDFMVSLAYRVDLRNGS